MKVKWLPVLPIIFSIIFLSLLGSGGYLLYQTGIKRDEYQWAKPPFAAATGIWIAIALVLIMLVISLCVVFAIRGMKKTHIVLYIVMSVAVVAYSTFSYISTHRFYDISSSSRITEISLSDLNQIREQKETGLIYIGRDGCRYCDSIYPNLEIFTATQKTEIKYYNTNTDRETNKAEMDKVLNKYGVTQIPVILSVENGIVTQSLLYNELKEQFQR